MTLMSVLSQRLWRTNCATWTILGLQNGSLRTGRTGLSRQVWNPKAWQKSDDKPRYTLLKIQVAYLIATSCAVPCCDSLWNGPNKQKQVQAAKARCVGCLQRSWPGSFRELPTLESPTSFGTNSNICWRRRCPPFLRGKKLFAVNGSTEPSDSGDVFHVYMFLSVRVFYFDLFHSQASKWWKHANCLPYWLHKIHGSTFPVEEIWIIIMACFRDKSPVKELQFSNFVAASFVLPHERTCLRGILWLLWHAQHVDFYQGFTQVRQGSKIQKYPWHWRSEHVWTEYLPTPTCHGDAMAKYGNGSNPLTQLIDLYAVVIWCRWDSFNLRWRVAAAGWTFNHPWIHNRPSLPIRKHCGLPNTRILSCGTQLKISCCWWTSWWVLHSIKWSMSSHKAETMARYRLVNRIHVMKNFPNAAQVVNSMSWFQPTEVPRPQKERKTSNGWAHLRRRQDSPHIPDTTCFLFE